MGRIAIGDDVFIGAESVILPGVTIANNCIIGAGSVVTHSITEEYSVAAGVPAKVITTTEKLKKKNEGICLTTKGMSFQEKKNIL